MSFHDLGLSDELLRGIDDLNYSTPTPIQEKAIPYVLMGRDVIGVAQTGTGKTASFTLPMIDLLSGGRAKARMPRSLILSPTRELASQIAANFDQFTKYVPLTKALLIGGESMEPQLRQLERGCDVLIATPGRLIDLFERGKIMLNDISIFVIDEADRMLDMGFIPDIERIGAMLSPMRQTLLFSATMPPEIKRLAQRFLSNPKEVAVAPPATVTTTVAQHLVRTDNRQKRHMLRHLLRAEAVTNAMVFCNRKRDVQLVADSLKRHGFNALPIHGDLPQSVRGETLEKFRDGTITILVCSDVVARGIDIKGVSHVFNFDIPFNAEDYVHRIGRTGRAGMTGIAYTLMTPDEEKLLDQIHTMTRQEIPLLEVTDFVPDERPDREGMGTGRGAGRSGAGRGERGGRDRARGKPERADRKFDRGPKPQQSAPAIAQEPGMAAAGAADPAPGEAIPATAAGSAETAIGGTFDGAAGDAAPAGKTRERGQRGGAKSRGGRARGGKDKDLTETPADADAPAREPRAPKAERSGSGRGGKAKGGNDQPGRGSDRRPDNQRHAGREANEDSVNVTGPGFGDELPDFMKIRRSS